LTATVAPFPYHQFFDNNGEPAVGYQLFVYIAGTTTKRDTWSDEPQTTANTNPIILDASGRARIFLEADTPESYKFVLAPPTDTDPPTSPIWTIDAVRSLGSVPPAIVTVVNVFHGTGTWTKLSGTTEVSIVCIGGGGGGGSGRRGAAGTVRGGGAGGAGGGYSARIIQSTLLGATETITVGAGGAGGIAVAVDNTNGNAGTAGTSSSFGDWLRGTGGSGGDGGTAVANSGGLNLGSQFTGGPGGAGGLGAAGAASVAGTFGAFLAAGGGGGGGGIDAANASNSGATGGAGSLSRGLILSGGSGAGAGVAGSPGQDATANEAAGGGGGGGGGSISAGGAGGLYGGAGGGGGASLNGTASGAGGTGANGIVVVIQS
jgi:Glycine-rich domain